MKKMYLLVLIGLLAAACAPALAQLDLKNGEDYSYDVRLGMYFKDPSGNQDWIREFDGRPLEIGVENFEGYGYKGPNSFRLGIRDLFIQNEDVQFDWRYRNTFGIRVATSALTHRLARNPALNPLLLPDDGRPPQQRQPPADVYTDLAPNTILHIDRRTNEAEIRLTPWEGQKLRLIGSWWQEEEKGAVQVLFLSRPAAPGEPPAPAARARFGSALEIDRETNESKVGFDAAVGKGSAVSYRFTKTTFDDDKSTPPAGTTVYPPLDRIVAPNVTTDTHTFKTRARISDRLYFTGSQTNRRRGNSTSTFDETTGTTAGRTNLTEMSSTNVSLVYYAANSLTFTGRYKRYFLDNDVPPFVVDGLPDNQSIQRDESAMFLEGTYTGIHHMFVSGSYENRDTHRSMSPLHAGHEEFEHPFTSKHTTASVWRAGLRYYPTPKLNLTGSWERSDIDDPGYNGTPTLRDKLDVQATYMARDNMAFYGNFNELNEKNGIIRVDPALIPTPADAGTTRAEAAGQGYRNKITTATIGSWLSITEKLTLDVDYSKIRTAAAALWIIGTDPAFLPHLFPDFVPYNADNAVWSAGLTYAFRPRWRVYARHLNTNTTGQSLISITNSNGVALPVGPVWQPIRVNERRFVVGFGHELSAAEEISMEFSVGRWTDDVDPDQSGRFGLVRLSWDHKF